MHICTASKQLVWIASGHGRASAQKVEFCADRSNQNGPANSLEETGS